MGKKVDYIVGTEKVGLEIYCCVVPRHIITFLEILRMNLVNILKYCIDIGKVGSFSSIPKCTVGLQSKNSPLVEKALLKVPTIYTINKFVAYRNSSCCVIYTREADLGLFCRC